MIENLSIISGALEVELAGESRIAQAGETLRYRGDLEHIIRNQGTDQATAVMVNILKTTVMD